MEGTTIKSFGKRYAFQLAFLLILLLALGARLFQLTARPFHSDEGVNYFFIEGVLRDGYYSYSHKNYHGPSFFYLATASRFIFGDNELGLRAPSIISGVGLIALLLFVRSSMGTVFTLLGAFILAISPSSIFHSRYAIHEQFLLFCSLWFAFAVYRWAQEHKPGLLLHAGAALGLIIATKETFIIFLFSLFFAFFSISGWKEQLRMLKEQSQALLAGFLLSIGIILTLYSGFFQQSAGVRELFLSIPQWVGRSESDVGHHKKFWYYFEVLVGSAKHQFTEPYVVGGFLLVFFSVGLLLIRNRQAIASFWTSPEYARSRFFGVWTLLTFIVYSFVKYKTVWLIINITVPGALFFVSVLDDIRRFTPKGEYIAAFLFVLTCIISFRQTVIYNYASFPFFPQTILAPYGNANPYSYVHTSPGMLELVAKVEEYMQGNPEAKILIGVGSYWPMPFYLRKYKHKLAYLKTEKPQDYAKEYSVIIVDHRVTWEDSAWDKYYWRLSDVQETFTYFKKAMP